jgi:hypothetical protein
MKSWVTAKFGRMRISTLVLIVVFIALFWVHQSTQPEPPAPAPPPAAVVPPGFVPDPNYTWVPRTNVRRPKEPVYTTTTTPPTTTTTTTTTPTMSPTPTTTVVDPDGFGPRPPETLTPTTSLPTTAAPFGPQTTPATTPPPS